MNVKRIDFEFDEIVQLPRARRTGSSLQGEWSTWGKTDRSWMGRLRSGLGQGIWCYSIHRRSQGNK